MKKKIIIISFLSALLIIILSLVFISLKNKSTIKIEVNNMIGEIDELISLNKNKYSFTNEGSITVLANYKGAHGENYPNHFNYGIKYESNKLTIIDDEQKRIVEYVNNDRVINMINKLSNLSNINIEVDSIKKNIVNINTKSFNDSFDTNFNKVYLVVNTSGLIKSVDSIEIHLDDYVILKKKSEFITNINGNAIRLSFSKLGYSLNVNNKLKMNVFIEDKSDKYSVVLNGYVYFIELSNDGVVVDFNSQAAIYNSINIKYVEGSVSDTTDYVVDDTIDNPIKRYLSNSDNSYWR